MVRGAETVNGCSWVQLPTLVRLKLSEQHDDLYLNPFEMDVLSEQQGLVNLMVYLFGENELLGALGCPESLF